MTTARDVIARAICWGTEGKSKCICGDNSDDSDCAYYRDADAVLETLLSARESVRLELAAKLNPWRGIETEIQERAKKCVEHLCFAHVMGEHVMWDHSRPFREAAAEIIAEHFRNLPAPPSEDKP